MSEEHSVTPPVTVAKRYRKQTSQSGIDDFVCIAEQSSPDEVQVVAVTTSVGSSIVGTPGINLLAPEPAPELPAAQSDSQLVSTPGPACTPLQILDEIQESTVAGQTEHALGSPAQPGSVSSQEFLSATEPFSVVLGDEPVHALHSLPQSAAISAESGLGASPVQDGGSLSQDTLVQTRSSLPCKRTAWDVGRSAYRATSKACHTLPGPCALPSKPVHVLRNTASVRTGLPRSRPVLSHPREGPMPPILHYRKCNLHLALWRKPLLL